MAEEKQGQSDSAMLSPDELAFLRRPLESIIYPKRAVIRRPGLIWSFEMDGKRHLSFGIPYEKLNDEWKQIYKEGHLVLPPMTEAERAYINNIRGHGLMIEEEVKVASSEAKEVDEEDKRSDTELDVAGSEATKVVEDKKRDIELDVARSEATEVEEDRKRDTGKRPRLEGKQDARPLVLPGASTYPYDALHQMI